MNYQKAYEQWLSEPTVDSATKTELHNLFNEDEKRMRFSGYMSFGTGGLRALMGAGTARMNVYTVAHATMGLANLIKNTESGTERGVAICYDSRNNSALFARRAAEVLSAEGIRVYLFPELRPTPVLSFAVRHFGCIAGINITASHNPAEYNGYKVYWEDGGQLPPTHADTVSEEIAKVDIFRDVPTPAMANPDRILTPDHSLDDAYIQHVLAERVNPALIPAVADHLPIVYTPLHGTGITIVPKILAAAGITDLHTVESQSTPDGNFPTVPNPNPEYTEAFAHGIILANQAGSDLIIATDPDADRVGVMARDKSGQFRHITGNQMGALLLDYIGTVYEADCTMPSEPYAVKTIVTSELSARVCAAHGIRLYNVLTGFKFIGEIIKKHEEDGHGTFLLGFEESYGYLKGTYARDKDAVVTTMLIAEMAAYHKSRGMTLIDALDELFESHGYFREEVFSIAMAGADGPARMTALMERLRNTPPTYIGSKTVTEIRDYKTKIITDLRTGEARPTGLPKSDVLAYLTNDENLITVRPSGTEPKVKIYVLANGKTDALARENADDCANGIRAILNA